jgi:hypothetical protein
MLHIVQHGVQQLKGAVFATQGNLAFSPTHGARLRPAKGGQWGAPSSKPRA